MLQKQPVSAVPKNTFDNIYCQESRESPWRLAGRMVSMTLAPPVFANVEVPPPLAVTWLLVLLRNSAARCPRSPKSPRPIEAAFMPKPRRGTTYCVTVAQPYSTWSVALASCCRAEQAVGHN